MNKAAKKNIKQARRRTARRFETPWPFSVAGTSNLAGREETTAWLLIAPLLDSEEACRAEQEKSNDGAKDDHLGHGRIADQLLNETGASADHDCAGDAAQQLAHAAQDHDHEGIDD